MSNAAETIIEGEIVEEEKVEAVEEDVSGLDELDEFIESFNQEHSEEEIAEAERAVVLEDAREEAYQEQDSKLEVTDVKMEKASKPAKSKTKRTPVKGMKVSEALRAKLGEKVYDTILTTKQEKELPRDELIVTVDDRLESFDNLAKKVREKVLNFYSYIAGEAKLSCYTQQAIDLLQEKGEITGSDIKKHYLSHPYSDGTASAQSSQMTQLLPVLGIATVESKKLKLNEDSAVLPMLSKA